MSTSILHPRPRTVPRCRGTGSYGAATVMPDHREIMTTNSGSLAAHTVVAARRLGPSGAGAPVGVSPTPTTLPTTFVDGGDVVPVRQRGVVAAGRLPDRALVAGERLVAARDHFGQSWWVAAESVWSDSDAPGHPEHPRAIGLATAPTAEQALLHGLSDRLGWEALLAFERGDDLPAVSESQYNAPDHLVVLDGRLDHDVPTVVVLGRDVVRWGAGPTWDAAVSHATFGRQGHLGSSDDVTSVLATLAESGLGAVAVDLGTPLLARCGIVRSSVQIVVS